MQGEPCLGPSSTTQLCISQAPRPLPRRWAPPCRTRGQPLSLSGPQTSRLPNRDPPPSRAEGAAGGKARVEETALAQAGCALEPPAPTLTPLSICGAQESADVRAGRRQAGDTGLLLPARRQGDERYVRPGRAGPGAPGPPPALPLLHPQPRPGASRVIFVKSALAPLAGSLLPLPSRHPSGLHSVSRNPN